MGGCPKSLEAKKDGQNEGIAGKGHNAQCGVNENGQNLRNWKKMDCNLMEDNNHNNPPNSIAISLFISLIGISPLPCMARRVI
jgi:hypothetical protein